MLTQVLWWIAATKSVKASHVLNTALYLLYIESSNSESSLAETTMACISQIRILNRKVVCIKPLS